MQEQTRRQFLQGAALASGALLIPGPLRALKASEKLTVALIGVGSQGLRVLMDLLRLPDVQIVAVCDVNQGSADYLDWSSPDHPNTELRNKVRLLLQDPGWGATLPGPAAGRDVGRQVVNTFYARQTGKASYSGCASYEDFRELLMKEHDLDAVAVCTPDHWHAIIAVAAMRAGKHVYSQKPMAHSVFEARQMSKIAAETGRATQVAVFNSQTAESRRVIDLVHSGAVGKVHRVDIWTKRASAFWKQGLPTPATADAVPPGLNWDLWLGPAPMRPYNRAYLPFIWRAWYDYGCGAIGDMGEYGLDTIVRALELGPANRVEASSTELFPDCYPVASTLHYRFPAASGEVEVNWYDGGIKPERPLDLAPDVAMSVDNEGVLYSGDNGKLLCGFMSQAPRLLSPSGVLAAPLPELTPANEPFDPARPELGGSATSAGSMHYLEWVHACRGGTPASANYAFEAPIVESLMLGNIAIRTQELLEWDASGFRLTRGSSRAAALLTPQYRAPWAVS